MKILFYCRGVEMLGVEYLIAMLKQAGHDVDLLFDPGIDDTLYYKADLLSIFQNKELLIEKAKRFSPNLLAFSSMTSDFHYVLDMAVKLKKVLKVPIIIGGIHASTAPEFVIKNSAIDMVCRGEGEEALLELVSYMETGKDYTNIRNIWVKKSNGIIKRNDVRPLISDLDSLPFPDKSLFYKYGCFKEIVRVSSGRGCMFRCSFCHNSFEYKLYHKKYFHRKFSVEYLVFMLSYYKKRYNPKKIEFEEDHFVVNKEWLQEFSYYYPREVGLPFYCYLNPSVVNKEIVKMLKKAGCVEVYQGFDAANDDLRKNIVKRGVSKDRIKNNVDLLKENKISTYVSAIVGWPGETPKQMWETVDFFCELSPDLADSHVLYPYPGTEIFEYCLNNKIIDKKILLDIYKGKSSNIEPMIFNHPYKDLAYILSKLLPIYVKLPSFARPLFRKIMNVRIKKAVNIIFMLFAITLFPVGVLARLKEISRMIVKYNIYTKK